MTGPDGPPTHEKLARAFRDLANIFGRVADSCASFSDRSRRLQEAADLYASGLDGEPASSRYALKRFKSLSEEFKSAPEGAAIVQATLDLLELIRANLGDGTKAD